MSSEVWWKEHATDRANKGQTATDQAMIRTYVSFLFSFEFFLANGLRHIPEKSSDNYKFSTIFYIEVAFNWWNKHILNTVAPSLSNYLALQNVATLSKLLPRILP